MTDLQAWIATLDEDQRQTAIAAGLHKPPDDDPQFGRNAELREFDGLETCRKNGALHPIERSVDHRVDNDCPATIKNGSRRQLEMTPGDN